MSTTDVAARDQMYGMLRQLRLWGLDAGLVVVFGGEVDSLRLVADRALLEGARSLEGFVRRFEVAFYVRHLDGVIGTAADLERVGAKWVALGGEYPGVVFPSARAVLALRFR